MMFRKPRSRAQFISTLRILAMRQPRSQDELDMLTSDCIELSQHLQCAPAHVGTAPEAVWHFLSDADIRFKDAGYAATQIAALRSSLDRWEDNDASP